jgi:Xaa-Pro aminopeptidase
MRKSLINPEFCKARRQRLAQLIPNCALILPAWPEYYRNADSTHGYRPESNLYYLTGFEEPEACLIFRPGKTPETVMFVRPKNIERETWDGFRFGMDGAQQSFGFDATHSIHEIESLAPELLKGCERVYYTMFRNTEFDQKFSRIMMAMHGWRPKFGMGLPPIEDAHSVIGELRIRKTEEEAEAMRRAAAISAEAHIELMKATRAGLNERALQGLFIKEIMDRGASAESYGGIVASGNNATTLHYRFNDGTLQAGDLLLVDCGAEYQYYAGDITRTYPVNGRFSPTQKRIYEKLLKLQKELIAMVKPGELHANLQKFTVERVCQILVEEKILKGSPEEVQRSGLYSKYYPHGVSHLLGLDVHDAGVLVSRGQPRAMEVGWSLTIEPGLYFPANDTSIAEEFRGIGIRIEDDILVTPDGNEVMTRGVPKEVEEMEALIGANRH